jgi:hypothetical protein
MNHRGGLIGETYQLNVTHLAYCSNDKVVPFVWPNRNAPTGLFTFLVLTGMTATGEPMLSISGDNTLLDYKVLGYLTPTFNSQITYFGCEPRPAVLNSTSTGTGTYNYVPPTYDVNKTYSGTIDTIFG